MGKEGESFIIDGMVFYSREEAEIAAKEFRRVNYIRSKTDFDDISLVLQVYNKLLEQNMFVSVVGLRFLLRLQNMLGESPFIENEKIQPIPAEYMLRSGVPSNSGEKLINEKTTITDKKKPKEKADRDVWKNKFKFSIMVNVGLALTVIVMFILASTINAPNIINYQNKLINQYAAWEQRLTEREQAVKEKEQELNINNR